MSVSDNPAAYNLEFGNGEFSEAEMKKIMSDERLAEDIGCRQSSNSVLREEALRFYLRIGTQGPDSQTEQCCLLTACFTDFTELTNQNNELKFRLQAMEQQAHLRDALHEALTAEVHRLKLSAAELREEDIPSNCFPQQNSMKRHMFPMQHEQPSQRNQLTSATSTTATGSTTPTSA
ncbi:hypothetical protein Leryth_005297 [Lithospermum erythrorhizon]|nr:hypothetical protein Leryth_005297 [Lithospermum erythrorhizon]